MCNVSSLALGWANPELGIGVDGDCGLVPMGGVPGRGGDGIDTGVAKDAEEVGIVEVPKLRR